MTEEHEVKRNRPYHERLVLVPLVLVGILLVFAVVAQPDVTLFSGWWQIQMSEAGLITDPMAAGGVGGALLNAAIVLFLSTMVIRGMRLPFTGVSFACLFMMAGFALLGKNLINIAPIILGGWLYARYRREPFSNYVYMTFFGTCLSPMVSFLLTHLQPGIRWLAMAACGVVIGFLIPAIARYTVRVHQGYNLYNVGFAAGFLGLGVASVLKGVGVEFEIHDSWTEEGHILLCVMVTVILGSLFIAGVCVGCRGWGDYRKILRHSGRSVADFIVLDSPGACLVNMALVGTVGFAYLLFLSPLGVRLNGPLVCCILSMAGFGAFGKHPKNVVPVMAGAVLAKLLLVEVPIVAPGVLLACLLCTGLAPIAGQFGWYWGVVAGFLHMTIVQNTGLLHGGMNLYNNGFAAGLVCVLLIPIIEGVKPEPKE